MGLDNGINLKIKDAAKLGTDRLPFVDRETWEDENGYDWQLLYWRKCYNVREVIFDELARDRVKTIEDGSEDMIISLDILSKICDKLLNCYTDEWWGSHDDSIWTVEDMNEGPYKYDLLKVAKLIGWLSTKDPDAYEIYFYDSY